MSRPDRLTRFVAQVGDWADGDTTLHRSLAMGIRRAIQSGDLAQGERLPSERKLARALKVSRTTVIRALQELREVGLVVTKTGSGSVIGGLGSPRRTIRVTRAASKLAPGATPRERPDIVDLSSTAPAAPDALKEILQNSQASVLEERGYWPQGLPALREHVAAEYCRIGLPTNADQIIITGGAQQAISIVAAVELSRGDRLIIEDPTYYGALDAYSWAGARLVAARFERSDVKPGVLEHLVRSTAARLLHISPTFQNPTGVVLLERARQQMAELADRTGLLVVEDDTMRDLWFTHEPPRPIAAYSQRDRVISIGSFSKTIWGGLRVGWMRVPRAEVSRYLACKAASDLSTSTLSQSLLVAARPQLKAMIRHRAQQNMAGCRVMLSELKNQLPDWSCNTATGGAFLWVHVPQTDTGAFQQLALRYGVACTDGAILSPARANVERIRLSFAHGPDVLVRGVQRLSEAWRAFRD